MASTDTNLSVYNNHLNHHNNENSEICQVNKSNQLKHNQEMLSNLVYTETRINQISKTESASNNDKDELIRKLEANYKKTQHKIEKHFNCLMKHLNQRKTYLLNKLDTIYKRKQLNLSLNSIENEYLDFSGDSTNTHHDSINGDDTSTSSSSMDELDSSFKSKISNEIINLISKYGQIVSTDASESHCTLTGEGLVQCFINEDATFTLACRDVNNNITKTHLSFLDAYITPIISTTAGTVSPLSSSPRSPSPQRPIKCKFEFLINGVYLVKYRLDKEGSYFLNILLNQKPILDSPYKINCLNSRFIKLSKQNNLPISCLTISNNASGIASTSNTPIQRKLLIKPASREMTKSPSFSIHVNTNGSTNTGTMTRAVSSYAASTIKLNNPTTTRRISNTPVTTTNTTAIKKVVVKKVEASPIISIDNSLNSTNLTDMEFTQFDDMKLSIGTKGRGQAEFLNPQSICVNNGLVYATDSNNQRVHVFTLNGKFQYSFGDQSISQSLSSQSPSPSSSPAPAGTSQNSSYHRVNEPTSTSPILRRPIGITKLDNENKILIADYENKCVNIFDLNGKYQKKICQNKLLGPKGICINKASNNEIVVADCKANAICIFNLNGKLIRKFGTMGNKCDNFAAPHYVSCMSNGNIVISDFYNHSIKVFSSYGNFLFNFGTHGTDMGQFNGPTGVCVDQYDNIIVADWGN